MQHVDMPWTREVCMDFVPPRDWEKKVPWSSLLQYSRSPAAGHYVRVLISLSLRSLAWEKRWSCSTLFLSLTGCLESTYALTYEATDLITHRASIDHCRASINNFEIVGFLSRRDEKIVFNWVNLRVSFLSSFSHYFVPRSYSTIM